MWEPLVVSNVVVVSGTRLERTYPLSIVGFSMVIPSLALTFSSTMPLS